MKKILYSCYIMLFICLCIGVQQMAVAATTRSAPVSDFLAMDISGKITDETGSGIPGVNILLKGTSRGTTTDAEGNYKISVGDGSGVLVFSFIGYQTEEISINGQTVINLQMTPDITSLEQVVVIGYGEQKKITMTGAVSSVSGSDLRQNPSASLQNTMAGRMPGFSSIQRSGRPGADGADFFIRGQSSYNTGSTQPLIIVDDIEFTYEQFARLDANEIETLSILKDASTTAIYGVKGANGVVVVTTRRGKIGPPQITARTEASFAQPTRLPHYLNSFRAATLYRQAQINDGVATPYFDEEDLALFKSGEDPYGHPNVNWRKELFKKFNSQYRGNIDVTGGTEKVKYFVSVGYLFQDGMVKEYGKSKDVNANYYHSRYNYRSNLDMKVNKTLDLRLDLYGNIGEINTPNVGSPWSYNDVFYDYSSFKTLAPFAYPIHNPNGTFGYSVWQRSQTNYDVNNIIGRLTYLGYNRNFENNMNFVASANQKLDVITKGLSLKGTVSYASTHGYSKSIYRSNQGNAFPSFIYDPETDTYTPRNANIYRVQRFFSSYSAGSTTRRVNLQLILNYDRTFGDHHAYSMFLLNQSSFTAYNSNSTYNFVPNNFRGYSFRAGYDYKNKYLFQYNMAYNGSDRFAEDKRYGFFPAVSAGWNIAEEPFFRDNVNFMERLKIRSSYGLVGNDKIGSAFSYYYEQTYSSGTTGAGGLPASFGYTHNAYYGVKEGTLGNKDVTWEKEKKFDLGIEAGAFQEKISLGVNYFSNERYDIMTTRGAMSVIFGQTLPPVNIGRVRNRGYEIEVGFKQRLSSDLSFSVKGNYSVAKNKILYQDEAPPIYAYQRATGRTIGQEMVYKAIGFYKDADDVANSPKPAATTRPGDLKYADLNEDGVIDGYDRAYLGYSNNPNTTYGISFGVKYKSFSFDLLFQGSKNFNVRGGAEAIQAFGSNLMKIHEKSWTPELGDKAEYPLLSLVPGTSEARAYPSTFWFISGNYLRLKTAEISYSLPDPVLNKLGVQNIRVFTNGYNLLTWSKVGKRYEFDPEINSGTDRSNYPPQRMVNVGMSITF